VHADYRFAGQRTAAFHSPKPLIYSQEVGRITSENANCILRILESCKIANSLTDIGKRARWT
jgi:hypothetical protein